MYRYLFEYHHTIAAIINCTPSSSRESIAQARKYISRCIRRLRAKGDAGIDMARSIRAKMYWIGYLCK